jgi:hypothetical protein
MFAAGNSILATAALATTEAAPPTKQTADKKDHRHEWQTAAAPWNGPE